VNCCNIAFAFPPWAASCFNETATKGLSFSPQESLNKSFRVSIPSIFFTSPGEEISTYKSPGHHLSAG